MNRQEAGYVLLVLLVAFSTWTLCHLVYLQYRQWRLGRPAWGGWMWRLLTLSLAISYLRKMTDLLWFIFSDARIIDSPLLTHLADTLTRPLLGPLLMHIFYAAERDRLPRPRVWRAILGVTWAIALPDALLFGVSVIGSHESWIWGERLNDMARWISDGMVAAGTLFGIAAMYLGRRAYDSYQRRRQWQWYVGIGGVFLSLLVLQQFWWGPWMDAFLGPLLALALVIVTTYYGERLLFFDLFAKRGLLFLTAFAVLSAHAVLVAPALQFHSLAFLTPWMYALTLLPLVMLAPWTFAQLNSWVDHHWLGRRYGMAEAVAVFSDGVRAATTEQDMLERAESLLSEIYQSRTCIDRSPPSSEAEELRAAIPGWGAIRILPRTDGVPFLSEDAALLRMLAGTLGSLLERRDLMLSAAQSELKALRAQINPHFLFNALNTIAALIPRRPAQAEETVERLAEVFRYTVRRADHEWTSVSEEIEFVRSYLEIEQARFEERLRVEIHMDPDAAGIHIPAMTIQTLAENAIKHGIAAIRGPGRVAISARLQQGMLMVRVEDNGPGFDAPPRFDASGDSSNAGYGLRNVQERLQAHYGSGTLLQFGRDPVSAATVVSFEIQVNGGPECAS